MLLWLPACTHSRPYFVEPQHVPADTIEVAHRLILIGDTGYSEDPGAAPLRALTLRAGEAPGRTAIAFLGDLIYEDGLPPVASPARARAERRIEAQIEAVRRSGATGIFIPGNHDWDDARAGGWARVLELEAYLDQASAGGARVSLQPRGGCPGPVAVSSHAGVELIVLDTQWWLHRYAKPRPGDNPTGCLHLDRAAVTAALAEALASARRRGAVSLVLAHHPLRSSGVHAGFSDWKMHVFPFTPLYRHAYVPLPVLGSIMPVLRAVRSPLSQDMSHPTYREMIAALGGALGEAARRGAAPLAYAAGHDHHLEVLRGDNAHYHLISGHGSAGHSTPVSHGTATLFAHEGGRPGFMQIDFHEEGRARLAVIEADSKAAEGIETYSRWLR